MVQASFFLPIICQAQRKSYKVYSKLFSHFGSELRKNLVGKRGKNYFFCASFHFINPLSRPDEKGTPKALCHPLVVTDVLLGMAIF